jgi:signal transduction histidine kinase/CheY-like chemotaxis protein
VANITGASEAEAGGGGPSVAEERDQAADQRDQAADQRDQAADQRDQAGEQRDQAGEQRDQAGEQRDQAAEQRDQADKQRDQAGEQRDQAGDQRDQAGDQRDQAGEQRDQAAEQRDQAGEQSEALVSAGITTDALNRSALARREAASDRMRASQDRRAGASERSQAELDRNTALADRGAGASERTHAELDRNTALADRGAGASERTHAELDRNTALADRGAGASERTYAELDRNTALADRGASARERDEQARLDAHRANRAKSVFLSRMSHELRTPLNAVLGFGQLLELDELSAEQRDSVEHIMKAGRYLLGLIDEVLDISRVESGELRLSFESVSLRDVVGEAVGMVWPLAMARVVRIDGLVAGGEEHVRADRQRLQEVVVNLLTNAVKYNREGGEVSVVCEAVSDGRLRLVVADTGIGIAEQDLARLFLPFERLGAEQSDVEGTGLGLTLTKQLVEAMGGEIGATSQTGVGSSFWVELPLADAPPERPEETVPPAVAPAPISARARTVLYVEDNLSNVELVERIVARRPEVTLVVAMQGRFALELAREHQPSLILLDLHLPDVSGEQVLRQLRADPGTSATPVVMLSADATSGQIQRLRANGATDYLTKPFDVARLLAVIDGTGSTEQPTAAPEMLSGPHVSVGKSANPAKAIDGAGR